MPQTQYNLHLKGYVGGADFDRNYVDYVLAKNAGKEVNVLIDSLGGNLATALSIAAAFKNHGKVSVHFVGMNASAATIASLGASHISIDKNAMYPVHKCSTAKHVLSLIAKSLSEHLNDAIWNGVRNASGDTTKDLFNGFDTITQNEITAGAISAENGNYMKLSEAITTSNAVDVAKEILFSLDPRLRSQDLYLYCSQDFVDKYNEAYQLTHGGLQYNTQYGQQAVEGSNGKLKFVPLYNKADSKFLHVTTKSNMLVGFDQMSDLESIMVKEYAPFVLSYVATMFFGVQFLGIESHDMFVLGLNGFNADRQLGQPV